MAPLNIEKIDLEGLCVWVVNVCLNLLDVGWMQEPPLALPGTQAFPPLP